MEIKDKIDITKYNLGIIIGRFQLHQLHKAHCDVIDTVIKNHKKVILFLGVKQILGSISNPLDFAARKLMIQEKYPDIIILSLPDKRDDEQWSKNLDNRIKEIFPIDNALLYGSRDSFITHYTGQFDTAELEQEIYISGTEIRKQVSEEIKSHKEWRAGVIFANYNRLPISYQTVSLSVFNEDETKILLCRKPEENKYRLIDGFVNTNDLSLEQSAKRIFTEESGAEISIEEYVGSFRIDDWIYRGERDKVMTSLFKAKYIFGHLSPSDDISELKWVSIEEISKSLNKLIMEEHQTMMSIILSKLKK